MIQMNTTRNELTPGVKFGLGGHVLLATCLEALSETADAQGIPGSQFG